MSDEKSKAILEEIIVMVRLTKTSDFIKEVIMHDPECDAIIAVYPTFLEVVWNGGEGISFSYDYTEALEIASNVSWKRIQESQQSS
jgi:hypothetical protein